LEKNKTDFETNALKSVRKFTKTLSKPTPDSELTRRPDTKDNLYLIFNCASLKNNADFDKVFVNYLTLFSAFFLGFIFLRKLFLFTCC